MPVYRVPDMSSTESLEREGSCNPQYLPRGVERYNLAKGLWLKVEGFGLGVRSHQDRSVFQAECYGLALAHAQTCPK